MGSRTFTVGGLCSLSVGPTCVPTCVPHMVQMVMFNACLKEGEEDKEIKVSALEELFEKGQKQRYARIKTTICINVTQTVLPIKINLHENIFVLHRYSNFVVHRKGSHGFHSQR